MGIQIKIDVGAGGITGQAWRSRRFKLALIGLLALCLVAAGVVIARSPTKPAFPKDATAGVNFPWYYPASLPKGAAIDPASFDYTYGIVTFVIKLPQDQKIVFNEQALPQGVDTSILQGQQTVMTNLGSPAQIKAKKPGFTGSVQTPTTLILANTKKDIDIKDFTQVFQQFRRY